MNPIVVFLAVFAVLTSIRRLFNEIRRRHVVQDHEALVRAKAALVALMHMQALLRQHVRPLKNRLSPAARAGSAPTSCSSRSSRSPSSPSCWYGFG
jgi:hypothetical protein